MKVYRQNGPIYINVKNGNPTLLFRVVYMTGKTIKKKQKNYACKSQHRFYLQEERAKLSQEGSMGSSVMLVVFFFLFWLVGMYVGVLFILFYLFIC